jgi:hypothetical protein
VSYGYAARTDTSVEKSKLEVDLLLAKNGAGARGIAVDENKGVAMISFVIGGLQYRLVIPMPVKSEKNGARPRGWAVWDADRKERWLARDFEQRCRSRWRAVVLLLKASSRPCEWASPTSSASSCPTSCSRTARPSS